MKKDDRWRLFQVAGPALAAFEVEVQPRLSRQEFFRRLRQYLTEQNFPAELQHVLPYDELYRRTVAFLRHREAIDTLRPLVKSADLRRSALMVPRMRRYLSALCTRILRFSAPTQPLTNEVLDFTVGRLKSIQAELSLIERWQGMNRKAVGATAKPEPESEFMWWLVHSALKKLEKRRDAYMVVAGVMFSAKILPPKLFAGDVLPLIESRVRRAGVALRREGLKSKGAS